MKSAPIFSTSIPTQLKAEQKPHQIIVMEEKNNLGAGKMKAVFSASMFVTAKMIVTEVKTKKIVFNIRNYSKRMKDSRFNNNVSSYITRQNHPEYNVGIKILHKYFIFIYFRFKIQYQMVIKKILHILMLTVQNRVRKFACNENIALVLHFLLMKKGRNVSFLTGIDLKTYVK